MQITIKTVSGLLTHILNSELFSTPMAVIIAGQIIIRIDVNVTPPIMATKVEERNVFFTCSMSGLQSNESAFFNPNSLFSKIHYI